MAKKQKQKLSKQTRERKETNDDSKEFWKDTVEGRIHKLWIHV